ncbi:MAG: sigma 54-interacting transcriptional regulator [Deltaproteobacteria bacterium]|nr:sigma 54-interacting transcriptional regulator [Deltaproteobacteria bacterium]
METKKNKEEGWLVYLKQLSPLFDMAYSGIVIVDEKGMIQIYNEAARKVLRIQKKDLTHQPIRTINPGPWRDMQEIIRTGVPQIAKKILIGNSTIIANRTPIIFEGQVKGVMSIFQDISEYEKVSSELESFKRLNKELDAIIESSYDGLYITDGESKTLRVNQAYERITGLRRVELIGKKTQELVAEGFFDPSVTLDVIKERRPKTIMQNIKGGKTVMVTGNPIFDYSDHITRVVTNVRDLTELNQLKIELEESKQLTRRYQDQLIEQEYLIQAEQELVIKSPAMRLVVQKALKMARVDSAVLLTGESGVGKDLLARFIHQASPRKENSFVKINCGAIPENLLESELFGYEKGAFTGARGEGKAGLLEIAHGGTVYLDEIAELPLYLQVKILGAIEDKEITRLGSTKAKQIDFRLIAATNRDLLSMTENGLFRKDLFFRLSTLPLPIPPLRERQEDIVPLINHFLKKFNKSLEPKKTISSELYEYLSLYSFPGNIRELIHIVEGLVVMSDKKSITLEDASLVLKKNSSPLALIPTNRNLKGALADYERKIIEEALQNHKTLQEVARSLGVNQSTISRKMHLYGIKRS